MIVFIIVILISIFWLRGSSIINFLSPTYDEPVHLIQGYTYLKTGSMHIIKADDQPVLAKIIAALPIFLLKPNPAVFTHHTF